MVKIDLKGIAKVRAKGRIYYYAWRKGPRLRGEPGSPSAATTTAPAAITASTTIATAWGGVGA